MTASQERILVDRVRARFPEEAQRTDLWIIERGFDGEYAWLEAFADRVSDAIRHRDARCVKELTMFVAEQYRAGSDPVKRIVDVAFAENIMWNVDASAKAWAWPHVAVEIRQLYADMWGTGFLAPSPRT